MWFMGNKGNFYHKLSNEGEPLYVLVARYIHPSSSWFCSCVLFCKLCCQMIGWLFLEISKDGDDR